MSTSPIISTATVILRKRKERDTDTLVIRLASSPSPSFDDHTESEFELGSSNGHRLFPAARSHTRTKRYACTYEGCNKAYTKPSRVAEHMRSHTGDRPFVCSKCDKSYLRESHLQAHTRSHLDNSERPLQCDEPGCSKRFWTTQHLRVHSELHKGERPFKCTEGSCGAAFLKHHHLREHICSAHAPPGTKPFRCPHPGCDKSFSMNQHMKTHLRTHDDKRYTCVNPSCLPAQNTSPVFYSTWTALQHHLRTAHPPKCPYPDCNGKTFSTQKGLRAHMKIHEQREVEEGLHLFDSDADDNDNQPALKKRRGGEEGRDWVCDIDDCLKDFKSKKALANHQKVNHQGRRDFVCPHETCGRAFGYKHLLQRHLVKLHAPVPEVPSESTEAGCEPTPTDVLAAPQPNIDDITGKTYKSRATAYPTRAQKLDCPYPDLRDLAPDAVSGASTNKRCEFVFSRAYDLRRHLRSEHSVDVEKEAVSQWMGKIKRTLVASS